MKLWMKILMIFAVVLILVTYIHYVFLDRGNSRIVVRIATTTSLYATGFLEYVSERFRELYPNIEIVFVTVGSGAALEHARRGDVCAVITHVPDLEARYLKLGIISKHKVIAYNFFVVVGPRDDPANVSRSSSFVDAFKRIYTAARKGLTKFISRADGSGTHAREIHIWRLTNISWLDKEWYIECGCGADQALLLANEIGAYTLSDEGTYGILMKKNRLNNIAVLYINSSDYTSINIYSMYIATNCKDSEKKYAELLQDFLYVNQNIVEEFGRTFFNTRIFTPARDQENMLLDIWSAQARGEVDV